MKILKAENMRSLFVLFFSIAILHSSYSIAQRTAYSIGVKGSFGVSVPNPHSTLTEHGQTYELRTQACYAAGMLFQYVLGDVVGIETGILNTYISYSKKGPTSSHLQQALGWDANTGVNSHQVPIQMMYIYHPRMHPNMGIKLTAGIAMDWLISSVLKPEKDFLLVSSILAGVRIHSYTGRYGRMEYGLQYQCSLNGPYEFAIQTNPGTNTLRTKYSVLSINLYYFFFNREN